MNEFARVSGRETTWVLQCWTDNDWKPFKGLFVRTLDDAAGTINTARASRPDITQWRVVDVATGEILATYS